MTTARTKLFGSDGSVCLQSPALLRGILLAVVALLARPALAERILTDPPPRPSAPSGAETAVPLAATPRWVEIPDFVPVSAQPLLQSNPGEPKPAIEMVTPPQTVGWDAIPQFATNGVRPSDSHFR